jgi:small basic protein
MAVRDPAIHTLLVSVLHFIFAYWTVSAFWRFVWNPQQYDDHRGFYSMVVCHSFLVTGIVVTVCTNSYVPDRVMQFFSLCSVALAMAHAMYPPFEEQMNAYVALFSVFCVALLGSFVFLAYTEFRGSIEARLRQTNLNHTYDESVVAEENTRH